MRGIQLLQIHYRVHTFYYPFSHLVVLSFSHPICLLTGICSYAITALNTQIANLDYLQPIVFRTQPSRRQLRLATILF